MSAVLASSSVSAPEGVRRLLGGLGRDGRPVSLDAHARHYGRLPAVQSDPHGFIDLVAAAGLCGRGGAGFPTAKKLSAVAAGRGRPVVVANGSEGEPPSSKDKVLLAYVPHLVLDGVVLAARTVGAKQAFVAVGAAIGTSIERVIAERRAAGLDRGIAIQSVVVPERFVSGEETALVQFINGGPCLPTFTPPRPFERGVGGAPTLVQNVETLANLGLIARFGADWFRRVGSADEPGSVLVTLSGAVQRPGVYEVALGMPLPDLLAGAGGPAGDLQALLIGGLFGSWIQAGEVPQTRLSRSSLASVGAAPGARAIVALPTTACGVAETAHAVRYLAAESAGQCGPCVHGLASIAGSLGELAEPGRQTDRALLRRRLASIAGRGACHHPDGAVKLVGSALRVFQAEFEHHERAGRCTGRGQTVLSLPLRAGRSR